MNKRITRNEILEMPAGRQMDAFVSELVFGCKPVKSKTGALLCECKDARHGRYLCFQNVCVLHNFSHNMSDAWKVVEKLTDDYEMTITRTKGYKVGCLLVVGASEDWILSEAETAPLAICRAALLAVTRAE